LNNSVALLAGGKEIGEESRFYSLLAASQLANFLGGQEEKIAAALLAYVSSVSAGLGNKKRSRNGVFGALPRANESGRLNL